MGGAGLASPLGCVWFVQPVQALVVAPSALQWEALGWLAGGFGVFAGIGMLARLNNKAASVPFVSRLVFHVCHSKMCCTVGDSALI